jgi:hypothetical protein
VSGKPSYLGLLNAIAVGERGGEALFAAWAAVTPREHIRALLQTVALREGEHAVSFAKRLDELGYGVIDRPDPELGARLATASSSKLDDRKKFERLGFSRPLREPDIFSRFFDDTTIDIATGELLGRYISEERDTGRRLRACYASLSEAEPAPAKPRANMRQASEPKQVSKPRKAKKASKAKQKSTAK